MKSFLEEYGFAILGAIVVILIIAMCTPVGNLIKKQVMNVIDSFAGKSESKLSSVDAGEEGVQIKQSGPGEIEVVVTSNSTTDKFNVEYRVKADKSQWGNYVKLADLQDNASKQHTAKYTITAQDGYQVQVRAKNIGKNDKYFMDSNVIRYSSNFVDPSQQAAQDQAAIDEIINNLNDDEVMMVLRGNGGTWPNGETSLVMVSNQQGETIKTYPSFDEVQEFHRYSNMVSRKGFITIDMLTNGMSEEEAMSDPNFRDTQTIYYDLVWKQINYDSNGIPIPSEDEFLAIVDGNGGALPNGDKYLWMYETPRGLVPVYSSEYTPDDFVYEEKINTGDTIWDENRSSENIDYMLVEWWDVIYDSDGIPVPQDGETVEVYFGNGGTLPNGDETLWIYNSQYGEFRSSDYTSEDFTKTNYDLSQWNSSVEGNVTRNTAGWTFNYEKYFSSYIGKNSSEINAAISNEGLTPIVAGYTYSLIEQEGIVSSIDYVWLEKTGGTVGYTIYKRPSDTIYWEVSGSGTLNLYDHPVETECLSASPSQVCTYGAGSLAIKNNYLSSEIPWKGFADKIKRVVIQDEIWPVSTNYWFSDLPQLTRVQLNWMNTSRLVNTNNMFLNSSAITEIYYGNSENLIDLSGVTSSTNMFLGCESLSNYNSSCVDKTCANTYIWSNK